MKMDVVPGRLTSDPATRAVSRGHPTVKGRGVFPRDVGTAGAGAVQPGRVGPGRHVAQQAGLDDASCQRMVQIVCDGMRAPVPS